MKVLLIHPPWMRFFGSCLASPPIALGCLAAFVRRELPTVEIEVYNADYSEHSSSSVANDQLTAQHEKYKRRLQDRSDEVWQDVGAVLREYQPDVIGISSMSASFPSALQVARLAKELLPGVQTILGGKHGSALPEVALINREFDFVVIGEGEVTLVDLLQHLRTPETVGGIGYRDAAGKYCQTPARAVLRNIDTLPIPIVSSRFQKYGFEKSSGGDAFTWMVLSARGCPFSCVYCASDKQVRFRSPEHVMEEIRQVKSRFGITSFCFEDDSFSLQRSRMERMCDLLHQEGVTWMCNTRADLLDDALIARMKRSGCLQVYLGIESGSPNTLARINKRVSLERIESAIQLLRKHHVLVAGFFIIGFPWETAKDMQATLNLIRRLPLDYFQLNLATPLPGTALFQSLVDDGKLVVHDMDWTEYHQGSHRMNFSRYPQEEWECLLRKYQQQAFRLMRKRYFWVLMRRLVRQPRTVLAKVIDRVFRNPRLLAWFWG